jgi:transcriptional regulator with XRE-family HTH domain
VGRTHLAITVELVSGGHAGARWDRNHLHEFTFADGTPVSPASTWDGDERDGTLDGSKTRLVVSGTYLWLLRTGQRDNPTMKHLIAIARFFGVPPRYFFPYDAMQQDAVPAELAAALSDDKVREMALRAAGLSDRSLKAITDMIDSARTVEGLPDDSGPTA